jgi:hypothetical protein
MISALYDMHNSSYDESLFQRNYNVAYFTFCEIGRGDSRMLRFVLCTYFIEITHNNEWSRSERIRSPK